MNVESFSYTVITAILGMSVVFVFLWVLSLLMSGIKLAFGEKPQKNGSAGNAAITADIRTGPRTGGSTVLSETGVPGWVLAAVATYLIEEELESQRSAEAWAPRPIASTEPWVALPRF